MRMRRTVNLFIIPVVGLGFLACTDSGLPGSWPTENAPSFAADSIPSGRPVTDTSGAETDSTTVFPLTLVRPVGGTRIAQNDSTLGCSAHQYRGYGFRWDFVWNAPESTTAYEYWLFVQHQGSQYPAVSVTVSDTAWSFADCNAFVIDQNADDWYWFVQAWDSVGTFVAASDTGWFGFQSCLLANGQHCYAPPGSVPLAASAVRLEKSGTGIERP